VRLRLPDPDLRGQGVVVTRTEQALLAAVIADPSDDLPRLAYADFRGEQGDDGRAEFIRVQIELARVGEAALPDGTTGVRTGCPEDDRRERALRRRERELLKLSYPWVPPEVADVAQPRPYYRDSWVFRRGFVAEISLRTALWQAHGPALVRAAPLEVVTLADAVPAEWLNGDWFMWEGGPGTSYLPPPIFGQILRQDGALCGGVSVPGQTRHVSFPAPRGRFVSALSEACLCWARAAAVAAPPAAGV
jgi:uncharacterized protein (TIGR02996 family)